MSSLSAPNKHRKNTFSLSALKMSSVSISLIIALPIGLIITSLFEPSGETWEHIQSTVLQEYLWNTFLLMIQVAAYTTVIGVTTAWLTTATEFPGRKILSWALMLPLAAPAYIVAYVYTDLLEYSGPVQSAIRTTFNLDGRAFLLPEIRSLPGAAMVISLVLYPYVYLLAKVSFSKRSTTLFDAARSLGASPWRAFFVIALPAARPAIVGGLALVLMETLADFGVVDYFGVPTFSTGIFRTWFALGDKAAAMKLAAVMFVFVLVLVGLEKSQRSGAGSIAHSGDGHFKRIPLASSHAIFALIICTLPVIIGCLIPLGVLIKFAITDGDPMLGASFLTFITNSVRVSLLAAFIAVFLAVILAYVQAFARTRITDISTQIATLGYALPGAMLAVGLLAPIAGLDRALAEFFETQFNWHTGLILTGTTFVLVYAYVIRFLTVAFNTTSSGLNQIPKVYGQAARSLGASSRSVMKSIYFPLMRKSLVAALILVFVDTMRELPATLLLRPFNFETLATRVYRLASDERLAEASTAAITIVIIGLIPVLFLNRLSGKDE